MKGSWAGKMLNYLRKFGQSLSVEAPDSESKTVGASESSLQELTSFIVEDDS